MWYNIDFNKWAILLLPTNLRKPRLISYLKSMLTGVVALHYEFLQKRAEDEFFLNHNGQVVYLRKALNDKFDNTLRRIQLGSGNQYQRQYIYTRAEQKPVYLGKMYLRDKTDYADTGVDYIVYVPSSIIQLQKVRLETIINYFNKASKKYKIVAI
ncbi:hypothetical protein [Tenacibaculum maritimum]|uniref:hypothetical protein n=1 Tax=Tenacibaculum maritimum TaxID=107401 RepID=UPI0012E504E1|nr:hypothetical protein [Tenacibaculum maritimum]MDB0599653.1 hypothetical protein [Tenacibaculum maritimum]MDB0599782.1 hypothetical protein [Tenacibaculum maritimum]MDB0610893.1 hypothetical protein [Tenacibaculum maritimum]MDB0613607.1 hypothetical protein [Tenacibaculum maritimum]CAA0228305.1 conserved hypothetical protein [Tenacibaculum maritimum]